MILGIMIGFYFGVGFGIYLFDLRLNSIHYSTFEKVSYFFFFTMLGVPMAIYEFLSKD